MSKRKSPVATKVKKERKKSIRAFDFSEIDKIKERWKERKKDKQKYIDRRKKRDMDSVYRDLKKEQKK